MFKDIFNNLKRQNSIIVLAASILTLALALTALGGSNPTLVDAQQQNTTKAGTFNYTQINESGDPEWIIGGNWSLAGVDSSSPTFDATIDMAKPDESAAHDHTVNNLAVSGQPSTQSNSTTIEGTTTITMREGPVTDEPTTIALNGNQISVYFDPAKIDDHFGNQSITGTVTE
ncbi:MAG TPA: hypothetical protein VFG45_11110 [Candidatus Nitrosocosmicus sp.]|nr:hypothetical protein [Candidatus Nitrosocosmicus sp.]